MNRMLLPLIPIAAVCTALGQTLAAPPAASANVVTKTGKIARVLAGPGNRPQGFLLHDGTFVILPPGLSQQMPPTLSTNTSLRVAGEEFKHQGSRTIHAQRLLLAGISYDDVPPTRPAPPLFPAAPRPVPASATPPCPLTAAPAPPAPLASSTARTPQAPPAPPPPPPLSNFF